MAPIHSDADMQQSSVEEEAAARQTQKLPAPVFSPKQRAHTEKDSQGLPASLLLLATFSWCLLPSTALIYKGLLLVGAPEPFKSFGVVIQSLARHPEAHGELRAVTPPTSLDCPVAADGLDILYFPVQVVMTSKVSLVPLPCLPHFTLEGVWDKNKTGDRRQCPPTEGFTMTEMQCLASKGSGSEPEQTALSDYSKHMAGEPWGPLSCT